MLELARRRPAAGVPTEPAALADFFTFRDIHTLVTGLATGRADHGVALAWCFDIPGEKGIVAGRETVVFALRERPEGLVSSGSAVAQTGPDDPGHTVSPRAPSTRSRHTSRSSALTTRRCSAPPWTASTWRSPNPCA
ncbi:hypothetical protein [Amycolatopsis speibonae]|uniref:Uncharacterized protein n=1 Tax=Amycolatopsis speibonae TaxID=1450224 RepID=A0ABV7NPU2_9PSEU